MVGFGIVSKFFYTQLVSVHYIKTLFIRLNIYYRSNYSGILYFVSCTRFVYIYKQTRVCRTKAADCAAFVCSARDRGVGHARGAYVSHECSFFRALCKQSPNVYLRFLMLTCYYRLPWVEVVCKIGTTINMVSMRTLYWKTGLGNHNLTTTDYFRCRWWTWLFSSLEFTNRNGRMG